MPLSLTLTPLANASLMIQIHTIMALAAVILTLCIFSLRKGSPLHRVLGWAWVVMMATVALSSFWINEVRLIGPFSPIHILSLFTLWALISGVAAARSRRVKDHKRQMTALVFGALVLAGSFTLLPGRIMHAVISGG
ncbi:DUF2306 domain-containing protein [Sulfitobacter sp. F26169L]|uniref:DUF2306 domain-containing protein n=1 Tax=Sulfitobacter sp. F26169L TaxID=2996015 RepID=UPI002260E29A|nr:DUF2306 domain-containing protein [Sulfitobacter sp. F26169L]MCX7567583.1 DUF2306 domain-containing protein [Sulfitobacter sp. F26169L]